MGRQLGVSLECVPNAVSLLRAVTHLQLPTRAPPVLFGVRCLARVSFSEAEQMDKSMHPTAAVLTSTVNLLQTLCLSAALHADVMQSDATKTLCGLLRTLVESGTTDKTRTCVRVCTRACVCARARPVWLSQLSTGLAAVVAR